MGKNAKINKWNFIKLKGFFTPKETIKKVMRNLHNGNVCTLYIWLAVSILKELKSIKKNTNEQ